MRNEDQRRPRRRPFYILHSAFLTLHLDGFTLADPNDRGMLDVVGFDTSVPAVISDFVRAA